MRLNIIAIGASLASGVHAAGHLHGHHHRSQDQALHAHVAARADENATERVEKRSNTCSFPTNAGLVAITPESSNGGWAMSPDQQCTADSYCPFACPPGQVMAQWQPGSTYTYPASMNGGMYCNKNGELEKPFPNSPYCVDGSGAVQVINKAGSTLSCCQTVLPGNEAMLIPTVVDSSATLAVPKSDYWCGTSSHFYINPPGVGGEGCIWGTSSKAIGNWAAYVAGANTDSSGTTFAKIGWNPEWLNSGLKGTKPSYSLAIECDGCNGAPCSINPDSDGINGVSAPSAVKADTGSYCVVTVPKGVIANIVVTSNSGGAGSSGSSSKGTASSASSSTAGTTSSPSSSATPPLTTGPTASYKIKPTMSSGSGAASSTSSNDDEQPDHNHNNYPGVFFEGNGTYSASMTPTSYGSAGAGATSTAAAAAAATTHAQKDEGAAGHQGGAVGSLVIALVVGLYLF